MVGTRLALVLLMEVVALWPSLAGAADYHHVHLTAPNIEEAAQWYITHMGCQALSFRNDACRFGATQVNFLAREPTGGSQGSGLDHFGISFPDLAAKMDELEAAGIAVTMPLRDIPGLFKVGFVEDPGVHGSRSSKIPSTWASTMSTSARPILMLPCSGTKRCSGGSAGV